MLSGAALSSEMGGLSMPDVGDKLDEILKAVEKNSTELDEISSLLIGDTSDSGKIGLMERIRIVEGWIAKREWFEKLVIAAIVANFIGLMVILVQNALK